MNPRILSIVPKENVSDLFIEIAKTIKDVDISVKHATMQNAASLASSLESEFDVIIARGETAKIISNKVHIPIVELELTPYEILSAIKQAEAIGYPFAIVGFPPLTDRAQRLADIMAIKLNIYTILNYEIADLVLQRVMDDGFKVIVSGTGLDQYISNYDLSLISITPTITNIETVITQAAMLGRTIVKNREANSIITNILDNNQEKHIVFDDKDKIVFNNINEPEFPLSICKNVIAGKTEINKPFERKFNDYIYTIKYREFQIGDNPYKDFTILKRQSSINIKSGYIKIFSAIDANEAFLSHFPHFSDISFSSATYSELEKIGKANAPIFLFGESGTGKKQMATIIYEKGLYSSNPYYLIECTQMNEKNLTKLLESPDSPLAMNNITICLNNLEKLSETNIEILKKLITESNLTRRIKLILCYETMPNLAIPQMIKSFLDEIGAISRQIFPLRDRKKELLPLAHIYINYYDELSGRDIIGLSPEAETIFMSYKWPGNLDQFKRVISELVILSTSCYISEDLVKQVIEKEKTYMTSSSALSSVLDINKPMGEIEKDIARAVLAKCNGNRSKAAERLKISRTTLWRLLSE